MNPPIVTGILAFGKSGQAFHAPFLELHPGFRLKAVVERHIKKAHNTYPGIISLGSVEELFEDKEIDLIVVNTPDHLHFEHASEALKAGKHVLLEKPAVIYPKQMEDLYALAEKKNRHLLVYQNRRWDSDFKSVKQIIESGRLGKLKEVHFRFDFYVDEQAIDIMSSSDSAGGNLIYGIGPHILDQILFLFGKPLGSRKVTSFLFGNPNAVHFFNYTFRYPEGLVVSASSSLTSAAEQPAYSVHGSQGSFVKYRSDRQEKQLLGKMSPDNPLYGTENINSSGILTFIDQKGIRNEEHVKAAKSSYMELFEAVYQQLVFNVPYSVQKEEVLQQIELLSREDDL